MSGIRYDDESVFYDAIRRCAEAVGHPPSLTEYRGWRAAQDEKPPCKTSIQRRLGSWTEAKDRAGLVENSSISPEREGEEWYYPRAYRARAQQAVPAAAMRRIYEALLSCCDGAISYPHVRQVAAPLEESKQFVSLAVNELARRDRCPLDIAEWSTSRGTRWRVSIPPEVRDE